MSAPIAIRSGACLVAYLPRVIAAASAALRRGGAFPTSSTASLSSRTEMRWAVPVASNSIVIVPGPATSISRTMPLTLTSSPQSARGRPVPIRGILLLSTPSVASEPPGSRCVLPYQGRSRKCLAPRRKAESPAPQINGRAGKARQKTARGVICLQRTIQSSNARLQAKTLPTRAEAPCPTHSRQAVMLLVPKTTLNARVAARLRRGSATEGRAAHLTRIGGNSSR